MKKLLTILVFLVSFISCKKEEKKTYSVSYKIVRTSSLPAEFTIRYTEANGSTQSQGPIVGNAWASGAIADFKPNTPITLSLESNSGEYTMYIYINGGLDKSRLASGGFGELKLETATPN
ncbi:MAG: hypothetical protein M3R27_07315 [Bacteroidota bacterium]|nr:hypothetical protein [Bacteroidota bacterium]